jgi:trans-aconitate 2-methyltransferase
VIASPTDRWSPEQYGRFAAERSQPFFDLLGMVDPCPGGAAVDLGCGTGELTRRLHEHLGAATTIGTDSSTAMLERAADYATDGLRFEQADINAFADVAAYDVVFANASLQWVPDHRALLTRLTAALKPGGQLAVQVPANHDHPSHTVAADVALEEPFASAIGAAVAANLWVLSPEEYADLLYGAGFAEQHVRLQVYPHLLASAADVVEWTKGTQLLRYKALLPDDLFPAFVDRYAARLVEALDNAAPYFYAFKRILFWGRLGQTTK